MRIVVDLPAPLLPRKPKISPRATSKLTSSTATNSPNRRVRSRTSMAWSPPPATGHRPIARSSRASARRAFAMRPRAIELGLQQRDLRVEHVGARRDAGRKRSPTTRSRFGGGANCRRRRRRSPRGSTSSSSRALRDLERRPGDRSRRRASSARPRWRAASACSARVRPPSQSDQRHVDRRIPRRLPLAAAREDARVRPARSRSRRRHAICGSVRRPPPRRRARRRTPTRCSSACRSGRAHERCGDQRLGDAGATAGGGAEAGGVDGA